MPLTKRTSYVYDARKHSGGVVVGCFLAVSVAHTGLRQSCCKRLPFREGVVQDEGIPEISIITFSIFFYTFVFNSDSSENLE